MDKTRLSEIIKSKSIEAGFFKVGFTRAEKTYSEALYLREWLDEKRNADMKWMANNFEKRTDPSEIMEDIRSVISLAYLYDTPVAHSENRNIPKISRYAWGERDYHKIIKKKLKNLCNVINSLSPEIKTRAYVDDGPVMDKAWAVRSGIGWMGKNTNVIDPDTGSFFFLAEILINAELDYDTPVEDLCKSCNLCINACPTGALYEEYKLDANLCISYQTIENRNDIPDEINLNGWIFGCDICQDVCPFNGKNKFTTDINFLPKSEILNKTYDELLKLSEDEFNKIFEGTPVRRTKYNGWKRNLLKAKKDL
ncbi:MAG: tRNA epoxyqueuosine(34) reductase QueG [Ignavibacteria bacterium]|nr:tRNA epoxyqueuosine(34) reductase QueG [Ignavibacteria bacterium]